MATHLTWTSETANQVCPRCKTKTVRLVAYNQWRFAGEPPEDYDDMIELDTEVTCNYCLQCDKVRSFSAKI